MHKRFSCQDRQKILGRLIALNIERKDAIKQLDPGPIQLQDETQLVLTTEVDQQDVRSQILYNFPKIGELEYVTSRLRMILT